MFTLYTVPGYAGSEEYEADAPELYVEQAMPPDDSGLWRDTKYFLGYQFGAMAILYAMPESVSGWSSEQKKDYSFSDWWPRSPRSRTCG